MSRQYQLRRLTLSGFRAYLKSKSFDFTTKRSLAVFAPNARGKSSLVDGIEFLFSEDGTLKRLGTRATNNLAGPAALAHNRAAEKGIASFVSFEAAQGRTRLSGQRNTTAPRERPADAATFKGAMTINPIIRGYELRAFVENQTPEERYKEVARWLDLEWLVRIQDSLRELKRKLKAAAEQDEEIKAIDTELVRRTGNTIRKWDDTEVLAFINGLLKKLDEALVARSLKSDDAALTKISERAKAEGGGLSLESIRHVKRAIDQVAREEEGVCVGYLPRMETLRNDVKSAEAKVSEEKAAAADAVFEEVWKHAEPLFAPGIEPPDTCPICLTPIAETTVGSAEEIFKHLQSHRASLATYAAAVANLQTTKSALEQLTTTLKSSLEALMPLLSENEADLAKASNTFAGLLETGTFSDADGQKLAQEYLTSSRALQGSIERAEEASDDSYSRTERIIDDLRSLAGRREKALKKQSELQAIRDHLDAQARFISERIRQKVQSLLHSLQQPIREIYREIQGEDAREVRLELPPEADINQQRLNLFIDFATNREGVQPTGYLSDSQIHSLGLALQMAAIRRFNAMTPLMVLDDVVTSYDADHRLAFVAMLQKLFSDFQIIIVTHEERFFAYLKDNLGEQNWQFQKILRIEPDLGPWFAEQNVPDGDIEACWKNGDSAANAMRQAEEEWLLKVCREFGVAVRIRGVDNAFSYERSELADALQRYLQEAELIPPLVPGVANRFLQSLQRGTVENFGSHFQDGQYGNGSQGDEKLRWAEFRVFRDAFSCPACGRKKFKRDGMRKFPACSHRDCETRFSFALPQTEGAKAS